MLGRENALKNLRCRYSENVQSVANICLPFQVQSHIPAKHNLEHQENECRIVHLELKALVEDYGLESDANSFEKS